MQYRYIACHLTFWIKELKNTNIKLEVNHWMQTKNEKIPKRDSSS